MTTSRTLCPLDCGWHNDQEDTGQLAAVEVELRAHLETHTLEHWTLALTNARGRAIRAERALVAVDGLLPAISRAHDALTDWKAGR